jgi:hypothetical protein
MARGEERLLQAATLHLSCVTARLASLGSCGDNHSGVHEPLHQVRFTPVTRTPGTQPYKSGDTACAFKGAQRSGEASFFVACVSLRLRATPASLDLGRAALNAAPWR